MNLGVMFFLNWVYSLIGMHLLTSLSESRHFCPGCRLHLFVVPGAGQELGRGQPGPHVPPRLLALVLLLVLIL
jgi:hypothetical protein